METALKHHFAGEKATFLHSRATFLPKYQYIQKNFFISILFSLLNFSKLKSKLWVVLGPPKLPFEHPFLKFFFRIWRSSSHYCKTSSAACGQTTPPDGRIKLVDDSTRPKFSKNMIFCGARAHIREW